MKGILLIGIFSLNLWGDLVVSTMQEGGNNAVVTLSRSGSNARLWNINDLVCITRAPRYRVVCGRIAQSSEKTTMVRLVKANANFSRGENVRLLHSNSRRGIASPSATETTGSFRESKALTTIGMGTGFAYLLFQAQFLFAVSRKVAFGITLPFAKSSDVSTSISALGVLITGNYFFLEHFAGYNIEAGIGPYFLSQTNTITNTSQTNSPLSFYTSFGWKGRVNRGRFNIGLAFGAQYVAAGADSFTSFQGLLPLLAITFGIEL